MLFYFWKWNSVLFALHHVHIMQPAIYLCLLTTCGHLTDGHRHSLLRAVWAVLKWQYILQHELLIESFARDVLVVCVVTVFEDEKQIHIHNADNISWITSANEEIGTFFINKPFSAQDSSNRLMSHFYLAWIGYRNYNLFVSDFFSDHQYVLCNLQVLCYSCSSWCSEVRSWYFTY